MDACIIYAFDWFEIKYTVYCIYPHALEQMQFYTASQFLLWKITLHDKNGILSKFGLLLIFLVAFSIANKGGLKILEKRSAGEGQKSLILDGDFHYGCVIFLKGLGNFCEKI